MKMTIELDDIPKILGKFIVQVSNHEQQKDLTRSINASFWLEKRISFVSKLKSGKISLNGFWYSHGEFEPEEFVKKFNNGTTSNMQSSWTRHFRILTSKELDWLFRQLKEKNY